MSLQMHWRPHLDMDTPIASTKVSALSAGLKFPTPFYPTSLYQSLLIPQSRTRSLFYWSLLLSRGCTVFPCLTSEMHIISDRCTEKTETLTLSVFRPGARTNLQRGHMIFMGGHTKPSCAAASGGARDFLLGVLWGSLTFHRGCSNI